MSDEPVPATPAVDPWKNVKPSDYSREKDMDPEGFTLKSYRTVAWSRIERLSRPRKSIPPMVQLLALREMVARTDPIPREPLIVQQVDRAIFVLSDEQAAELESGTLTLALPEPADVIDVTPTVSTTTGSVYAPRKSGESGNSP